MLLKLVVVFVSVCAIGAQILPPSGFRRVRPGPTIMTSGGPVQGQEETYDLFRRIYTYKGIPYADAPVGELRFAQSIPPIPWTETLQAWEFGSECPQFSFLFNRYSGDENCLFINVATPVNIRSRLPVVVSIHGGGLQFGNGNFDLLGPELINQENVIFVSLNYRLNVLGFLNTGDANSPGNYGIKDMILALQWVQHNIEEFGGNRDDVTIHGISGGAIGVHALVVSPVAAGLFHKAISHSGSLFNNWGFNQNPLKAVEMLTTNLQLDVYNNQDLVNQLRQVTTERLLRGANLEITQLPALFEELTFMPSVDPISSPEARIFPGPISFLVRFGLINLVPYMVGFNAQESLNAISNIASDSTILERFNHNPNLLVPTEWGLTPGSIQAQEVITAFRHTYFGGSQNITTDMAWQWANYVSDREFIFGISKQARLHRQRQNVFYFRFSYSGSLNFAQRILGLSHHPVAMHGDDAFYLFRLNLVTPVLPSDEAYTVQRRYVRLWTNFIKYGNPTPTLIDPIINVNWSQLNPNENFLDIDSTLYMDVHPFSNRMDVWHDFDQRFNP